MPNYWEEEYGLDPDNPYDADFDNDDDGLTNLEEYELDSNPLDSDTDDDGLLDGEEVGECPDVLDSDSDNDGLSDGEEITLGTDPCNSDTDGDGIADGVEVESGTDPLDPTKTLVFEDNDMKSILFKPALWQDYNLGIDGGTQVLRYSGGLGYTGKTHI